MHTYTALCFLLMPVCVYVASMRDMLGNASVGTPSLSRLPSQCHGAVACLTKLDVERISLETSTRNTSACCRP